MSSFAQSVICPHTRRRRTCLCPSRERASTEVEEAESIIQFEINDDHHVNSATLAITVGQDMGKPPFQRPYLGMHGKKFNFRGQYIFYI